MILAGYIRPFDAKQKIYVLDSDKDTQEVRLADLSNYSTEIMQLITEYNVTELKLFGNFNICLKVKDDIQRTEFSKYNNNQLKITIEGV